MVYIGVYGTLKMGQRANGMLVGSVFIGEFRVVIPFQMFNLGAYPVLVEDKEDHPITLEIYEVTYKGTLHALDRYEGYPSLYQKSTVKVENMDVTIYTMKSGRRFTKQMEPVESGNWE